MTTDDQIAANRANSQHSTGPRTEEGKAASSRNAITFGLFTMRDFVRAEEKDEYDRMAASHWQGIAPQTALEQTYVTAIISAAWRLRRCGLVEAGMAATFGLDPMEDAVGIRIQTSVDRARSQSFNILHRSTAEIRRLQTDRAIGRQLFPGEADASNLISHRQIIASLAHAKRCNILPFQPDSDVLASNCKPPESTPRSAPCPCGSGEKYKRCCGKDAPPVLGKVA